VYHQGASLIAQHDSAFPEQSVCAHTRVRHHRTPLVLGTASAASGSTATARRRARASALNADSARWWSFSPCLAPHISRVNMNRHEAPKNIKKLKRRLAYKATRTRTRTRTHKLRPVAHLEHIHVEREGRRHREGLQEVHEHLGRHSANVGPHKSQRHVRRRPRRYVNLKVSKSDKSIEMERSHRSKSKIHTFSQLQTANQGQTKEQDSHPFVDHKTKGQAPTTQKSTKRST
jgi:hypothetical protein